MTKIRISCIILLLLLSGTISAFAQDLSTDRYIWQNFQFSYPTHWAITLDQDAGEAHQVKLVATQDEQSSLLLSLMKNFDATDQQYTQTPVMASVSFGLGPALNLAGNYGESAIALSYGSIELATGPVLSARFTVSAPEPQKKTFYMLECFHGVSVEKEMAFFGMIVSKGTRGQVADNPTYHQYIAEAYAIARSILIQ